MAVKKSVKKKETKSEPGISFLDNKDHNRVLARVTELSQNAILIADEHGRILWANDSFSRITEYSLDEVIGKKPSEILLGPETDPATLQLMSTNLNQGKGVQVKILNYTKSNRKIWLAVEVQPLFDEQGKVINFFAIGASPST